MALTLEQRITRFEDYEAIKVVIACFDPRQSFAKNSKSFNVVRDHPVIKNPTLC
jgi:hypothetical protein